jgi:hypothetical protein
MDRPHVVTIGFSLAAIVLSGISLWQSNQNLTLTKAISRAAVEVTQVRIITPELHLDFKKNLSKSAFLNFSRIMGANVPLLEWTFVNFGKSRATNIKVSSVEERSWGHGNLSVSYIQPFSVPSLSSGRTQSYQFKLNYRGQPDPDYIRLTGALEYTDEVTGKHYHERWCYQSKDKAVPVAEFVFCSEPSAVPPSAPSPSPPLVLPPGVPQPPPIPPAPPLPNSTQP